MDAALQKIDVAADFLRSKGARAPEVGLILGSGLGGYAERLEDAVHISYSAIPGFPVSTAPSHKGEMYLGKIFGKEVIGMSGRIHFYEGLPVERIIFPVRVMARLGIKRLILTNSAGSINLDNGAGHLMLITDHINLSGVNPLIGPNADAFGPRFPDMTKAYDPELRQKIRKGAVKAGLSVCEGVYAMMSGPSFETPAEINFLRLIGADAVGMSTVPEVIAARHAGLQVAAISFLSNMAAGVLDQPLSGEEVVDNANRFVDDFTKIVDIAIQA